tara:strand:+ start:18603 stop:19076 length:474 start_codon:yes stop_codon:yes gene_type:complete
MSLIKAIINKYGFREGLNTRGTKNGERIISWPYDEAQPSVYELPNILLEYQPVLDSLKHELRRDKLEAQAVILYNGNLILMDDRSRKGLNQAKDSLSRRSKSIKWKVFDTNTGEKKRIDLNSELISKFEDSVVDEIESLHIQADTQSPVNPWPVEVV